VRLLESFVYLGLKHLHSSSVEIIPGGLGDWPSLTPEFPVLLAEGNVGIPYKVLLRLYLCALSLFNPLRSNLRDNRWSDGQSRMVLNTTATILLANPAHQTALNSRKRLVQSGRLLVPQELGFNRNHLCSCRESAKQSILWNHREWLLRRQYIGDNLSPCNIPTAVLQKELDLIMKCSEIYPRNYHAWAHWHFCLEMVHREELYSFLTAAYLRLVQWVERNVSDYTAIHHLYNTARRLQTISLEKTASLQVEVDATPRACFDHAMALVSRYPEHESLWMYLRVVCQDAESRDRVMESVCSLPENEHRRRCVLWLNRSSQ